MPLVADLMTEIERRIGRQVADAGLYLDADPLGGTVATANRTYLEGIRRGLSAVGIAVADLYPVDAEVAHLTSFARDRVLDQAELFALGLVQLGWPRALRAAGLAALDQPNPQGGVLRGTLAAEKQAVDARVAALKADCARPYREPAGAIVVNEVRVGPYYGGPEWRDWAWGPFP